MSELSDRRIFVTGAGGGKILGTGGFLLLLVEPELQPRVTAALAPVEAIRVAFEPRGSRVIYSG